MRLNRLDLIRYGRFKDAEIAFPRQDGGTADVTVVFGPNEAGKSTAFQGFLELLFGFKPGAHPYAFKFARSDLLVGADLDLPGSGPTVLRRNGKRARSLLDAQGRPVEEAILVSALHGLDRDAYVERFSLNNESLRRGGERIAGAQGDLGQLLHAGVSDLTGMAATLDEFSARADHFHKKHGRSTALKAGKDRLTEIGRELRADRLTVERERKLRRDRDLAGTAFEAATAELRQAHQRQAAAKAAQLWYDLTEAMRETDEALADFPDGPDLPPNAAERVAGLVEKCAGFERRIAEADADVAKLDAAIAANPVDPLAEALSADLARLDTFTIDGAPLMGRATTARADLARRQEEKAELDRLIAEVLAQLSASEVPVTALALAPESLEGLASAEQDCLTADLAAKAAQEAADTARTQLGEAPAEPQDLSALRKASEGWREVADLSSLKATQDQAAARLTRAIAGLPHLWRDLVDKGLPARETLDEVARDWTAVAADLTAARAYLDARAAESAQARAERAALEAAPNAVDIAMTEDTRRMRDMSWQRHRDELNSETADRFQAAMYADDSARAHFLTDTEARQRLQTAQVQERTAQARHDTAKARHDDLGDRRDRLLSRCTASALALGFSEDAAPTAFVARHQALAAAAEAAADLSIAQDAVKAQTALQQAAQDTLAEAARPLELNPDAGDLPAQAQRALTLEDSDRRAWTQWQDAAATITELVTKARNSHQGRNQTRRKLDRLTAALPLSDRSPEGIRAALPHMRSLQRLHTEHGKLSDRIEALERAISALADGALRLVRIMDVPADAAQEDPLQFIDSARIRATAATRADEKRADDTKLRDETVRAKERADAELRTAKKDFAACFDAQGGRDLHPCDRVARLVERDRLRGNMAAADRDWKKARASVDADLFSDEVGRLPDATRAAELEQALTDAQDARDAARDVQHEAGRLYREAYEAADRSDLATEQATLLEELRSGARQAVVARLGVLAARGALRRLAAERRSSMLRDVEEAFVTMTTPAWTGVDVWSQDEGAKLVGVQPGGATVPVEHMSAGTMGQLYFALRLAGYRGFARAPGPLPMILDDIMEAFDDTRARAALQLCAEIGTNGQAILFTHHAHLVALARDSIPGVTIIDMPE